jgi:transposase-like protein
MTQTVARRRAAWSDDVRARAAELARDPDSSAPDVRAALREELGADVPLSTVIRWVRELRRSEPIDRTALLRNVADRAACLLSSELERLERQTPKTRDLGRLDAVVRTLKTLSGLEAGKSASGRQTLGDLQTGAEAPERAEGPMRLAS